MTYQQLQSVLSPVGKIISIMRDEERLYIYTICQHLISGLIAEVGVSHGGTTLLLHAASGRPIIAADSFSAGRKPDFESVVAQYRLPVTILEGNSWEVAEQVPDASCALVLIDADHEGDAPYKDLLAWSPKVKVGGYLLVDDVANSHPAVTEALLKAECMTQYRLCWCCSFTEVNTSYRFIKLASFLKIA